MQIFFQVLSISNMGNKKQFTEFCDQKSQGYWLLEDTFPFFVRLQ